MSEISTIVIATPVEQHEHSFEDLKEYVSDCFDADGELLNNTYFNLDFEPTFDDDKLIFKLSSVPYCPYDDLISMADEYCVNMNIVFADENGNDPDLYNELIDEYEENEEPEDELCNIFSGMNAATIITLKDDTTYEEEYWDISMTINSYIPKSPEEYLLYYLTAWNDSVYTNNIKYFKDLNFVNIDQDENGNRIYISDVEAFFDWLKNK